jgi:hypothetical protein
MVNPAGDRSRAVWEFVQQQRGRLWLEYLPGYTPELNPVEYLWSHWKQHELPNFCPQDFGQLSVQARRALQRMRRRPTWSAPSGNKRNSFPCTYIMGDPISGAIFLVLMFKNCLRGVTPWEDDRRSECY